MTVWTKPSPHNFRQALNRGLAVESVIAQYLRRQGFAIIPAYEKQMGDFKGPQVFTPGTELVAPDLMIMDLQRTNTRDSGKVMWVEVKDKSVFSWHRNSKRWMTGIDKKHHGEYVQVSNLLNCRAFVFFFHQNNAPSAGDLSFGCPAESPTGLFVVDLIKAPNHDTDKFGKGGMVFWTLDMLTRVASVKSVLNATLNASTGAQQ